MNQVATLPKKSLVDGMAARYDMEPKAFVEAIKASVIKGVCSNEQFAAFLMVAKEYDLNPLTKEIYAFPDRGGITPIVSIDGWMKLINSHPQFDGMEFDDTIDAGKLSSVTCRMYRKDRSRPISVIEYMSECSRPTEPWKKWPARMLRHKAAIQAARYAFGFSGIMEPDEYDRMKDVMPAPVQTVTDPFGDEPQSAAVEDAEIVTTETETLASAPDTQDTTASDSVTSSASEPEGGEGSVNGATLDNSEDVKSEKRELMKLVVQLTALTKDFDGEDKTKAKDDVWSWTEGFMQAGTVVSTDGIELAKKITRMFVGVAQGYNSQASVLEDACNAIGTDIAEFDEVQ